MKTRWLLVLTGLVIHSVAVAQGTINFSTRVGANLDAPVYYLGELLDGSFLGQLYVGPVNGPLAPTGNPTPFRSDAGRGYITSGGTVEVPGLVGGELAQVKLVAWAAALGASYVEAVARDVGGYGESAPIILRLGGDLVPPTSLIGPNGALKGFSIPIVPEPAAAWLGCVGLIVCWWMRRRR
ncbi:MAG: hypothetical protein IT581_00535 [Verrucomicrobiales bacterium]|nr:hypothetical protein [Verrucomicrobiales bacterium]